MSEQPSPDPITEAALRRLEAGLPGAVVASELTGRHPYLVLDAAKLRDACLLLRDDETLRYDCCHLLTGTDWPDKDQIEVVYHLVSYTIKPDAAYRTRPEKNDPWLALKVFVPRGEPAVPSVADIWTGADWHERETYDLVGVVFTGRAELRRILLPEDWPGHPLRKDWEFPVSYHGIPIIPPEAQP